MYPPPPNQDAYAKQGNSPPAFHPAPVTGVPLGSSNQYYNQNIAQQPIHHHQNGREGPWSSGLCDCCSDPANCCLTCWCPCITFGQITEIVDKGKTSCGVTGAVYGLLYWFTGCACCLSCFYRSKLRKEYQLEERPCNDFLVHCCCETCALCQEYRELQNRGFDMSIGWQGNMEKQNRGVATGPRPTAPVFEGAMSR